MFHLVSRDNSIESVRQSVGPSSFGVENFSRLHKLVLRLTSEPAEVIVLQFRSEVGEVNDIGWTALHWAVCARSLSDIDYLFQYGADPDIQDRDWKSPLHISH